MIVDHRTYELQPGRLRDFLALYEKEGLPVQLKHHRGHQVFALLAPPILAFLQLLRRQVLQRNRQLHSPFQVPQFFP